MDQHSPSRYPSPDIARIDASCEIAYPRSPERIKVDPGTQRFSSNPNSLSPSAATCVKNNTLSPHYNNPSNNQNSFNNNSQQATNTFNNQQSVATAYNANQNSTNQASSSSTGSTGILFTKNATYNNNPNQLQPGSYTSNQLQPNNYSNTNQLAPPTTFNQSSNQLSPNMYNQNSNQLSPGSFAPNQLSPMQNSPSYYQAQPVSPNSYPRTPSPQAFPLSAQFYNEIATSLLTNVVSQPQFKAALEQILKEKLAERKDFDNTLKRLWIFQHLIETPCQKCCFINNDPSDVSDGTVRFKFRIKSKCLANHFRVSGNTPFNWLVRDFCRVHAPHSAGVNERKDLREIYYDEFGLFNFEMTTNDFIVLAQRLSGRPTTSSKKRKRKNSGSSSSMLLLPTYESPPSKVSKFDFSMSLNESSDGSTLPKFEPAETPRPESPSPQPEMNISSPIPLTVLFSLLFHCIPLFPFSRDFIFPKHTFFSFPYHCMLIANFPIFG